MFRFHLNKTLKRTTLLFIAIFGFIALSNGYLAANIEELKGTATAKFLNEGNEFHIHWGVDKEKNIEITRFTDESNKAVLIVEGKHTLELPIIESSKVVLVHIEDATIIVDQDNKIISAVIDGIVEFDDMLETIKKNSKK